MSEQRTDDLAPRPVTVLPAAELALHIAQVSGPRLDGPAQVGEAAQVDGAAQVDMAAQVDGAAQVDMAAQVDGAAQVDVAAWEAFERSLAAEAAFLRAELADVGVSLAPAEEGPPSACSGWCAPADPVPDRPDRPDRPEAQLAALRAARQAADVPLAAPGVRPSEPVASSLSAELDAVEDALRRLLAAPASGSRADVARVMRLAETMRLASLRELGEMHVLGTHTVAGGPKRTTGGWLASELDLTAAAASSQARLAGELRDLPVLADAVAGGSLTTEHARAITDGIRGLDVATVQESQQQLVDLADGRDPAQLRDGLKNMALALDDRLAAEAERRSRERAGFTVSPVGERYSSNGSHDAEQGATIKQAVDLAAQQLREQGDERPVAARRAQVLADWARAHLTGLADADSTSQDVHTSRTHVLISATPEQLEAASLTPAGCTCSASPRPGQRLLVHDTECPTATEPVTLADLVDDAIASGPGSDPVSSATNVSSGTALSRGALRRLCCDAVIGIVAVHAATSGTAGAGSEAGTAHDPLWVGRSARTVTRQQWLGLVERDRHCVVRGCRRPPAACIAHHVRHWLDGGLTDMGNLVLLCEQHHHEHHDAKRDLPHRDGSRWMTQLGWRWFLDDGWTDTDPALHA